MTQLTSPSATDFDRTTALIPVDGRPGEFVVELDAGWSSLVGVHGGYMCATGRAGGGGAGAGRVGAHDVDELPAHRAGSDRRRCRSARCAGAGRSPRWSPTSSRTTGSCHVSRLTLMTERSGVEWDEPRPVDLPPPAECVAFDAAGARRELRAVRAAVRPGPDAVHRDPGAPRRLRAAARGAPGRRRLAGDGRRLLPAARVRSDSSRRSAG